MRDPLHHWVPPHEELYGNLAAGVGAQLGMPVDDEQKMILDTAKSLKSTRAAGPRLRRPRSRISRRPNSSVVARVKDLPHGRRPLRLWWNQRRWACRQRACRRRTFAEISGQIGPGQRLTGGCASRSSTRCPPRPGRGGRRSGVWGVVVVGQRRADRAAALMTPQAPAGVRLLGVDETRARSVRWLLAEHGWRRSDPWMTSFVDLDPTHPGGLLGLAPGRSGASVRAWLGLQKEQFQDGIEVVAVDPSAPFAAALRDVLPSATLVVDHWHLHRLANLMVTRSGSGSPSRSTATAAARPTTAGPTGGCCCAAPGTCPAPSGAG